MTLHPHELPSGYIFRVTRYADVILRDSFPHHWHELTSVLTDFQIDFDKHIAPGGGNRSKIAEQFDGALKDLGWAKQNMNIDTKINEQAVASVKSHEIDMFKKGPNAKYPGIAVEMEWNNKDPFYDRDLSNFYALHRAGALAVGIVVTRGPRLQIELRAWEAAMNVIRKAARKKPTAKFGASTTHWLKLMSRVNIGGGGECPLFLIGIEPERVLNLNKAQKNYAAVSTLDDEEDDEN